MKAPSLLALITLVFSYNSYSGECSIFSQSTLNIPEGVEKVELSLNFPTTAQSSTPWLAIDFASDWKEYMNSVVETIKDDVKIDHKKIVLTNNERWFSTPWMDYGNAGREPINGLTRERGPREKDVAPNSPRGGQVWAVGWYNDIAATNFSRIFKDPCNPRIDEHVSFDEGSVAIKFLFTTLDANSLPYLKGAPQIEAYIDPANLAGRGRPEQRVLSTMRLLQVDLAVKDHRAIETGWLFGTYVWMNSDSEGLFENLVPVSLAWGDDPKVYNDDIKQSRINTDLKDVLYGWEERPFLGFMGRANGPADNAISSCISCHGSAQFPRPKIGNLDTRTPLASAIKDQQVRKKLVDERFVNQPAGTLFDNSIEGAVAMDYSLQLQASIERICAAWCDGHLSQEPSLCKLDTGFRYTPSRCRALNNVTSSEIKTEPIDSFDNLLRALDNPRG
jgi:hypothetical protein